MRDGEDDSDDMRLAAAIGADRVELYTGPYAEAHAAGDAGAMLSRFAATARRAQAAGVAVNAGHDLSQDNLGEFLRAVPNVLEVSIGHALIGEALYAALMRRCGATWRSWRRCNPPVVCATEAVPRDAIDDRPAAFAARGGPGCVVLLQGDVAQPAMPGRRQSGGERLVVRRLR
jgi:hypothetical protein